MTDLVMSQTPVYAEPRSLGVVSLVCPLPVTTWSPREFVDGGPIDLQEAAMVDGCTNVGVDRGGTMAAAGLFTLPVLAFLLAVPNRMVGGLAAGAVTG